MNTTLLCRDVRPATENNKECVVVAYRDVRHGEREIDLTDAANLADVRERLRAEGIVLGGSLQPAPKAGTQNNMTSPLQIIAHDEHGEEHRLIADHLDEYSLSSGMLLYYLYVSQAPCDCRWLVGRTLEVVASGSRQPDLVEPIAAANRPRE